MPFTFTNRQKSVAFFMLTGVFFFLVLLIIVISGSDLIAMKEKHFTYFSDAHGFTGGTAIKYKGFNIGKIKSLNLTQDGKIRADFYIYRKYAYLLKENSVLRVQSSLLGASNLSLFSNPDPTAPIMKPKSLLYSSDMNEGQEILLKTEVAVKGGDELTDKVKIILDDIHNLKPFLDNTLVSFSSTMYNVNSLVAGMRERDDIGQMSELLKMTLAEVRSLIQTIQKVFGKKPDGPPPAAAPSSGEPTPKSATTK